MLEIDVERETENQGCNQQSEVYLEKAVKRGACRTSVAVFMWMSAAT